MKRSRLSLIARAISLPFISAILIGSPALPAQAATPAFVQVASAVPQSLSVPTISATYAAAQTAGNLNVVVIGWNDTTARVSTVSDTSGNVYKLAVGPTLGSALTQSIYYAPNIAAAAALANSVKVTFTAGAVYPDLRVLEYRGMDPITPLDVSVGASGNNGTSASGALTTTNANDLLVGANLVATDTRAAGAGFTSRIITSPNGDNAQDQIVSSIGSYSATAVLTSGGPWVMQLVAFRAAGTVAPPPLTAPTNLTATAFSSSQINLSWTASTGGGGVTGYRVERCQGAACSTFAQVATPTLTTSSDTGLTASTSYSYRVLATSAAGPSGYSATATAVTQAPAPTAPSAPTNLTATAASSTQINLTWTAPTSGSPATGYQLERCQGAACSTFAPVVPAPAGTTYSDTALTASTSYSYRVLATSAAGPSTYSATATATTQAPAPTAPSAPTNLTATAASSTQINLTWTAPTSGSPPTGYQLERCQGVACSTFAQVATPTLAASSDTGLTASTSYSYRVLATSAAGPSTYSATASATTQAATPPPPSASTPTFVQVNATVPQSISVPSALIAFAAAQTAGNLNVVAIGWNDTTATVASVTDTSGNTYQPAGVPTKGAGLTHSTYYASNIAAAAAGANTVTVVFSTGAVYPDVRILEYSGLDQTTPLDTSVGASGSGGLSASGILTTTNATDLLFAANVVSTDTRGAGTGFTSRTITRPNGDIAEDQLVTAVGSYSATAPLGFGDWVIQLVAFRAANGAAPPPPTPPSAPTNLTATVTSSTQVDLTWTAPTSGSPATGYQLERCQGAACSTFAQIATPSLGTYSDTGLTGSTAYSYRVLAKVRQAQAPTRQPPAPQPRRQHCLRLRRRQT